jgi:hypothetical protein
MRAGKNLDNLYNLYKNTPNWLPLPHFVGIAATFYPESKTVRKE